MMRFKIFFGTSGHLSDRHADSVANEWLEEHDKEGFNILDVKYQQARMGDHSICILYEETDE